MICKLCAAAADLARINEKLAPTRVDVVPHCNKPDCACQHRELNREEYLKGSA